MIRPATQADGPFLFDLVNKRDVIFWSGRQREITPQEHQAWLRRALANDWAHKVFVAEWPYGVNEPVPVGYGRLEFVTEARVSFAVAEDFRGKGVGKEILGTLEENRLGAPLVAYVHPGNTASLRAFLSQGYTLDEMRTEKGTMWQVLRKS